MKEVNKYDNRIVVFIDILGFSNIIKSTVGDKKSKKTADDNFNNIKSALSDVQKKIGDFLKKNEEKSLRLSQFSDSIVISINEDSNIIVEIVKLLREIQISLLYNKDILIRGGVVKGLLVHSDQYLFGPAMINAYLLESKCAFSPRIIVMPDVKKKFDQVIKENDVEKVKILRKDNDGTFYVDYFSYTDGELESINAEDYFRKLCLILKKNITNKDYSLKLKYYWMRDKLKKSNLYKDYKELYSNILYPKNKKVIKDMNSES